MNTHSTVGCRCLSALHIFSCSREAWQILNKSKEKEKVSPHWCLTDKLYWQEDTASRQTGTARCLCTCIMHTHFQWHVHRQEAHMSAPHLPRYQNTISPDKLECARAWQILTLQVSVTFLSELHVGFTSRQRSPEWTRTPPLPLSVSSLLPLSAGYRMKQERGARVSIACCIILSLVL